METCLSGGNRQPIDVLDKIVCCACNLLKPVKLYSQSTKTVIHVLLCKTFRSEDLQLQRKEPTVRNLHPVATCI